MSDMGSKGMSGKLLTSQLKEKLVMPLVLLALIIVVTVLKPVFLTTTNLLNVMRQISFIAVIALGTLGVLVIKGMDLSAGSIVGLTAVVFASFAHPGEYSPVVALLIGLSTGALVGLINGAMCAICDIPPFITTLSTMTAVRGFAMIFSGGKPIGNITESLIQIGTGKLLGIPVPIYIMLAVAVITHLMLTCVRVGRHIFAIGGNEHAAVLSGINVKLVTIFAYVYSGLMASLSSIMLTARVQSGQPGSGSGFEMQAIAAAVIGGTSLSGGVGSVTGTIIGALIIGVINNGLDLMNVNTYWQSVAQGVIIALAVFVDRKRNGKKL